ncbi:MAG: DNA polymerase III subunit delta' [Thermodesulfobacteriota bacterium]
MLIPFSAITGQDKARQYLTSASKRGKLSHAYLFKGPGGVGKKMMAHAFAALLNCQAPQGQEICGNCPSCRKFASGNQPDLLLLEPEGAGIKIKQIRDLQQKLTFPPFEAKERLVLLADVHETMRRAEVANALLKTLEEPPERTILILTVNESTAVLPTIISRCQTVPFHPLPEAEVSRLLVTQGVEEEEALALAAVSGGSPGRAHTLHKKELLQLRADLVAQFTSLAEDRTATVTQVFAMAAQAAALQDDLEQLLDLLAGWLRDLLLLKNGAGGHLAAGHGMAELLQQGACCWPAKALEKKVAQLQQARRQLAHNCNRTLTLEVLFFALLGEKC